MSYERLVVRPRLQRCGLGTWLMHVIEGCFPTAGRYKLFTVHLSERNTSFYRQLGYEKFREEEASSRLRLIYLEKLGERPER